MSNWYKPLYKILLRVQDKTFVSRLGRYKFFADRRVKRFLRWKKGGVGRHLRSLSAMKWYKQRFYFGLKFYNFSTKKRRKVRFYHRNNLYKVELDKKKGFLSFYRKFSDSKIRKWFKEYYNNSRTFKILNFLKIFETRLDVICFRLKLMPTIFLANFFIKKQGMLVNNSNIKKPSYILQLGDTISFKNSTLWRFFSGKFVDQLWKRWHRWSELNNSRRKAKYLFYRQLLSKEVNSYNSSVKLKNYHNLNLFSKNFLIKNDIKIDRQNFLLDNGKADTRYNTFMFLFKLNHFSISLLKKYLIIFKKLALNFSQVKLNCSKSLFSFKYIVFLLTSFIKKKNLKKEEKYFKINSLVFFYKKLYVKNLNLLNKASFRFSPLFNVIKYHKLKKSNKNLEIYGNMKINHSVSRSDNLFQKLLFNNFINKQTSNLTVFISFIKKLHILIQHLFFHFFVKKKKLRFFFFKLWVQIQKTNKKFLEILNSIFSLFQATFFLNKNLDGILLSKSLVYKFLILKFKTLKKINKFIDNVSVDYSLLFSLVKTLLLPMSYKKAQYSFKTSNFKSQLLLKNIKNNQKVLNLYDSFLSKIKKNNENYSTENFIRDSATFIKKLLAHDLNVQLLYKLQPIKKIIEQIINSYRFYSDSVSFDDMIALSSIVSKISYSFSMNLIQNNFKKDFLLNISKTTYTTDNNSDRLNGFFNDLYFTQNINLLDYDNVVKEYSFIDHSKKLKLSFNQDKYNNKNFLKEILIKYLNKKHKNYKGFSNSKFKIKLDKIYYYSSKNKKSGYVFDHFQNLYNIKKLRKFKYNNKMKKYQLLAKWHFFINSNKSLEHNMNYKKIFNVSKNRFISSSNYNIRLKENKRFHKRYTKLSSSKKKNQIDLKKFLYFRNYTIARNLSKRSYFLAKNPFKGRLSLSPFLQQIYFKHLWKLWRLKKQKKFANLLNNRKKLQNSSRTLNILLSNKQKKRRSLKILLTNRKIVSFKRFIKFWLSHRLNKKTRLFKYSSYMRRFKNETEFLLFPWFLKILTGLKHPFLKKRSLNQNTFSKKISNKKKLTKLERTIRRYKKVKEVRKKDYFIILNSKELKNSFISIDKELKKVLDSYTRFNKGRRFLRKRYNLKFSSRLFMRLQKRKKRRNIASLSKNKRFFKLKRKNWYTRKRFKTKSFRYYNKNKLENLSHFFILRNNLKLNKRVDHLTNLKTNYYLMRNLKTLKNSLNNFLNVEKKVLLNNFFVQNNVIFNFDKQNLINIRNSNLYNLMLKYKNRRTLKYINKMRKKRKFIRRYNKKLEENSFKLIKPRKIILNDFNCNFLFKRFQLKRFKKFFWYRHRWNKQSLLSKLYKYRSNLLQVNKIRKRRKKKFTNIRSKPLLLLPKFIEFDFTTFRALMISFPNMEASVTGGASTYYFYNLVNFYQRLGL